MMKLRRLYAQEFFLAATLLILFAVFFVNLRNGFGQATTTTSTVSISVEISGGETQPPPPGASGDFVSSPIPGPATLVFEGLSSPDALIYFYRNSTLIGTGKAETTGFFAKKLHTQSGISTFGIAAKDSENLLTSTVNLSLNLLLNATTTVSNVFLSPTLITRRGDIPKGAPVPLRGSAFPLSSIFIFSDGTKVGETAADEFGNWRFAVESGLQAGLHEISARAFLATSGLFSAFSLPISVSIDSRECSGPDLNRDGEVNIADLSIMLYYWREINPRNICVDLNNDSIIDIADVSLLMYAWTGDTL